MAEYKIVNATQLDSDLKNVADSIREKSGAIGSLTFPDGFKSTVDNIQKAKPEQTKTQYAALNQTYTITPDEGKVLSSVTVNVNVEPQTQYKNMILDEFMTNIIDENGFPRIYITPDEGKFLEEVCVDAISPWLFIRSLIEKKLMNGLSEQLVIPDDFLSNIGEYAFYKMSGISEVIIPPLICILEHAFGNCTNLTTVTFHGAPSVIWDDVFSGCNNLTIINVPWAEGEIHGAPWGATNATINYNYTEG